MTHRILKHLLVPALLSLIPTANTLAASDGEEFKRDILPLLRNYCYDCHDSVTQKSGLDLERFTDQHAALQSRSTWATVLEKVESMQMPPPKDEYQPTATERERLIAWIHDLAARPDLTLGARDPGKPLLRRLTRLEYNNTVRDLLGLETDVFMFSERLPFAEKTYFQPERGTLGEQIEVRPREYGARYPVLLPGSGLPGDNRAEHGYRNRGDANNLSPLLLEKYVALAGEIANHPELQQQSRPFAALAGVPFVPKRRPPPSSAPVSRAVHDAKPPTFAPKLATLSPAADVSLSPEEFRSQFALASATGIAGIFEVVPESGNRTISAQKDTIQVPFGSRHLALQPSRDLWLVGFSSAEAASGSLLFTNKAKGDKVFSLNLAVHGENPEEGVATLAVCVLGRRGQSGRVMLTARFSDATEVTQTAVIREGTAGTTYFGFSAVSGERIIAVGIDGSGFSGDYILLDDLAFITNGQAQTPKTILPSSAAPTVPIAATTPAVVPNETSAGPPHVSPAAPRAERLQAFLERAFRRDVTRQEIDRYLSLWNAAVASGKDELGGARIVLQTVLASPSLLFLTESTQPEGEPVRPLNDFEIASRLSYFLWSTLPDEELLAAARAGKLRDPATLATQTRRMLRDPKIRELGESFAVQWLRLDQLSTAKPDTDLFKPFYAGPQGKDTLHSAMLTEALLLFETVLIEDRSILEFIGADYTWLNPRLAKVYGLASQPVSAQAPAPAGASNRELREAANKAGNTWVRTRLHDPVRGGFIAMGGPLTVTSFPFRTSPVKRGAWLLETIFNRPPQEPKVAFAIENDTKEAAAAQSIREKFEAHRNKAACYSCHVRLDPPGFALERFDPIGRWREIDGGQPVDARGEWKGEPFDGPAGYKAALLKDPSEFTRGFTEHLLTYALGRKLDLYDLPAVREIQQAAAADDHRFGRLIVELVKSYPFLHTRNRDLTTAAR